MTDVVALCIHTMAGSLSATDGWFANPASQVSAHYGVGLDGALHQYVKTTDAAWTNGVLEAGNKWASHFGTAWVNGRTCSIETEDKGNADQPVTDAQYAAVLAAGRLALTAHPTIKTLCGHSDISPSSKPNCPGARWRASGRMDRLAHDLGLGQL